MDDLLGLAARTDLPALVPVPVAAALAGRRQTYFAALDSYRHGDADQIVLLLADAVRARSSPPSVRLTGWRLFPGSGARCVLRALDPPRRLSWGRSWTTRSWMPRTPGR